MLVTKTKEPMIPLWRSIRSRCRIYDKIRSLPFRNSGIPAFHASSLLQFCSFKEKDRKRRLRNFALSRGTPPSLGPLRRALLRLFPLKCNGGGRGNCMMRLGEWFGREVKGIHMDFNKNALNSREFKFGRFLEAAGCRLFSIMNQ